jgi:hypothetical protein
MKVRILWAAIVAALTLGGNVRAGILLDLEDPASQFDTPFSFTFTASASSTKIEFAGYQLPDVELARKISFKHNNAGANLLGLVWTYTPAPAGAAAGQGDDGQGTGTNGLLFAAFVEDSFDTFDQSVTTVAGESYTLSFLYTNNTGFAGNEPSGFVVSNDVTTAPIPEPATLTLLGMGLAGMAGYGWRKRKEAGA